jgi:hypothetical protein
MGPGVRPLWTLVSAGRRDRLERQVFHVDTTFFDVFSVNFLEGDGRTPLRAVVITPEVMVPSSV